MSLCKSLLVLWVSAFIVTFAYGEAQNEYEEEVLFSVFDRTGYLGEVPVVFNSKTSYLLIKTENFVELLRPVLKEQSWLRMRMLIKDQPYIPPQLLYSLDIKPLINFSFYKIFIEVSPELRNTTITSLRTMRRSYSDIPLNEGFNGYLNYSFGTYIERQKPYENPAFFNPVISYKNWTLENNLQFKDEHDELLRYGTRLIHDDVNRLERTIIGEQFAQSTNLDFSFNFLGISHSKEYSISPQYQFRLLGQQEFLLETPSRVEVYVNNLLIQVLQLPAGKHTVNDIPVARGINNILLKVSDGSGVDRVIVKQLSIDQDMLGKKEFIYGLNGGRLYNFDGLKPVLSEKSVGSVFLRYGFSEYLTSGLQIIVSDDMGYGNLNNSFGTKVGTFRHDLKFSNEIESGLGGVASKQTFFWMCACWMNNMPIRLGLFHEYATENFIFSFYPDNQLNVFDINRVGATYSVQLLNNLSFHLGGNKGYNRGAEVEKSYDVGVNFSFSNKLSVNLSWRLYERQGEEFQYSSFLLSYFFDRPNTYLSVRRNQSVDSETNQADYVFNQNKQNNNFMARVSQIEGDQLSEFQGFSTFSTSHTNIVGEFVNSTVDKQTTNHGFVGLNGSIAFVGNNWSFGKPIYSSFVMVTNNLSEDVTINGDIYENEMYVPKNSSRLLTITQPYYLKDVTVYSAKEESLEPKKYNMIPRYKQGVKVDIQKSFMFTIVGEYDLKKLIGEVRPIGGLLLDGNDQRNFFITEDGKFIIEHIAPGEYEVTLFGKRPIKTRIIVPQSEEKIIDIGLQTLNH